MRRLVIVITGATAGIGRATARRFAADRAAIALLARGRDGLAATAREVEALGGRALAIATDVADRDQVFAAAAQVERTLGPIDVWINNAMTTVFGRLADLDAREYRRVTDVTYHGVVWGTQAALQVMRPRNRGVIVQVGSSGAHRAVPLQAACCGAKHAVRAFTDALRSELIHDGIAIRLTMVQLPSVNTPQFRYAANKLDRAPRPIAPIFQPEVAADAIHFAALHPRREVLVGASVIGAVIGQATMPGVLDRFWARVGFRRQRTDRPPHPGPSNLFEPVPGDHGGHGDFEFHARRHDPIATLGSWLGAAGLRMVAAAAGLALLVGATRALGGAPAPLGPPTG